MATLSSAGIGSNLDINGIITKLMQVESQPLTALDTKEASYQAKLTAYGSVKGALSSLQSAAKALKDASKFTGLKASTSDATVVNATAGSDAVAGVYAIDVSTLARAQIQVSTSRAADTTTALGVSGSMSFTVGSSSFSVTVAATDNLQGIVKAINSASDNVGVVASIVNDGVLPAGNRLVISAKGTGTSNAVTINDSLLSAPFSFTVSQPAQDLSMKVNGITVTKPSNTVTDVVPGVTLNVLKGGGATVTATKDPAAAKSAIDAFVKAYNDLNKTIKDLSAYNAETKKASVLQGEASVRTILSQVRATLSAAVGGTGAYHTLSQLGVAFQSDGSLKVDSTKLGDALSTNPAAVADFFAGDGVSGNPLGLAVRLDTLTTSMLGTSGVISSVTDGLNRSIKDIGTRRETLNRRLLTIESNYRKQFTALDTLISNMNQTSTYLTQQLANLPKAG